jgi:tetratricopeptide (TPR) repeat protein
MNTDLTFKIAAEDGKRAFEAARYDAAAEKFREAARGYAQLGDALNEAEQNNNLSVTLLKLGRAREAFDLAHGTDELFARHGDVRRQGIALNNQAAALEDLKKPEEALAAYERAAELLGRAGEKEYRSLALKAAAALQLRRGRVTDSGVRMVGVLESREHPSILERILKFILRLVQR